MRLVVGIAIVLFSGTLQSCDNAPSLSANHILEVKCETNTGFDQDKRCLRPVRTGADLEIRINATTQKVQISIIKNDGNWWVKDSMLENCSVIDATNWKCTMPWGSPRGPVYMLREYGMVRGQYYSSLTGGGGDDYYTSGISGLTYWALHYDLITLTDALKYSGYASTVIPTSTQSARQN
jgi:hypothetical protein